VKEPLPEGAEVSVVLEGPGSSPAVRHAGRVAHTEADPAGGHRAAVEFRDRLGRVELLRLT
jgi:hypothetical protein